jgi:hypothetical protein
MVVYQGQKACLVSAASNDSSLGRLGKISFVGLNKCEMNSELLLGWRSIESCGGESFHPKRVIFPNDWISQKELAKQRLER